MFFSTWRYPQECKNVLFVRFMQKQDIISRKLIIFANKKNRL